MAEQQSGLRFDIYERVHLSEGMAAIRELNDVELVPHIQVLTEGDQAILKGNLLLTGAYIGEEESDVRTLEHFIPVEITLPMNRITRVEDILVDIENFDVDLLSSRSLNVTGVLSLQGVEMISASNESWRNEEEEEVTFVHEAEEIRVEPAPIVPGPVQVQETTVETSSVVQEAIVEAPPQPELEVVVVEAAPEPQVEVELEAEQTQVTLLPDAPEGPTVVEEKKELKVAFGKKADEAVELKPYGVKSLLKKATGSLFPPEKRKDEVPKTEEPRTDAVEWKKLFLGANGEDHEFSKMRMCIVQKEETLDAIAKRYQVTLRELQLLNRLNDHEVAAGQIIYIPK